MGESGGSCRERRTREASLDDGHVARLNTFCSSRKLGNVDYRGMPGGKKGKRRWAKCWPMAPGAMLAPSEGRVDAILGRFSAHGYGLTPKDAKAAAAKSLLEAIVSSGEVTTTPVLLEDPRSAEARGLYPMGMDFTREYHPS